MKRRDNIKDLDKKIADQEIKPEGVDIVMITSSVVPTQMGSLGVMILGLGTDDRVYQYNGAKQNWLVQK